MRGQMDTEFLVILVALLTLVMVLVIANAGQKLNLSQSESSLRTLRYSYEISSAVNYVYLAGEGTEYSYLFPAVEGSVRVYEGFVEVKEELSLSSAPLLTRNIVPANVSGGAHTIRNTRGVISIE